MKWLDDRSLPAKLMIGFALVLALIVGTGGYSVWSLARLDRGGTRLYAGLTVSAERLGTWRALVPEYGRTLTEAVHAPDAARRRRLLTRLDSMATAMAALESEYGGAAAVTERDAFQRVVAAREAWEDAAGRARRLAAGEDPAAASALVAGDFARATADYSEALRALAAADVTSAAEAATASTALYHRARAVLLIVLAFAVLAAVVVARTVGGRLSDGVRRVLAQAEALRHGPIHELGAASEAMANGQLGQTLAVDLTPLSLAGRDEVGQLAAIMDAILEETRASAGSFNRATRALKTVGDDRVKLVNAVREGRLSARADLSEVDAGWTGTMQVMNDMMDEIASPINEARAVLERLANGDLTARISGSYPGEFAKVKEAVNRAAGNLERALLEVKESAEQVATSSEQIGAGAQELAHGAADQASSLEEVSSSLHELSAMTRQNAASTLEARKLAEEGRDSAARGREDMRRLSDAVERIRDSSDSTARIVKTIDEIAFQTNLLALNAAVEAARAGDAGKGFAVVAEEVRALAQRSAGAAKETADLIEESVRTAEEGVSYNRTVLARFDEIHAQTEKVGEVMAEVSIASEQQSEAVGQINTAVEEMNGLTQRVASNSEESASAAEEMAGQSGRLRDLVIQFRLSDAGAHPGRAARRDGVALERVEAVHQTA